MTHPKIVITGMGMISALGLSAENAWSAIESERSGLGPLTLFRSPRCGHVLVGEASKDCARFSGLRSGSRNDHLAVIAASSAATQAGITLLSNDQRASVGIVLGACTGGMLDTEQFLESRMSGLEPDNRLLHHHECASSTNSVARMLGLAGFRATVSTACSSGAMAIAVACDVITSGESQIMLAGGVDSLTRLTLNGFCSLLNVANDGCRPFDSNRNGMSLGEGAGVLVLESEESAKMRGIPIIASIAGIGSTCDAHHVTAPSPDGIGIYNAMCLALKNAHLAPTDIDYINAHGTGTRENDAIEGQAIGKLFGTTPPLVSSTKRFFGHALAAAGAIEAIVCIMALMKQQVPANLGLLHADPLFSFAPVMKTTHAKLRTTMSNSLGFGGNNCTLIICRDDDRKKIP